MKKTFDDLSELCSKSTTKSYSTSFYSAVNMLDESIRQDVHNVYGFVRLADEIVDSFEGYDKTYLLDKFENDFHESINQKISLNPILNAFQKTIFKYNIDLKLVDAFLKSMRMDLDKKEYFSREEYERYIYGSADVVGLMCLKIFVNGNENDYIKLKPSAMKLGSAFQKVNFLRDFKSDIELLERSYFPNVNLKELDYKSKQDIINEIKVDFQLAYEGIIQLPKSSKRGVYTAYVYYQRLLKKLDETHYENILESRIRVNDFIKMGLMAKSFFQVKLNIV
jgi:phytoene/squalene synthetase